jgi:hypothetical protein
MGLQYGIKEVCNLSFVSFTTNKPLFYVDYAEVSSNENSGTRLNMSAGQGNYKITSWDHSKESKFKVTLPEVDLKMLALLAGEDFAVGAANVFKREVLTVTGGKVTLEETPLDPTQLNVFALEGIRDNGTEYTKTATAPTGQQFTIAAKDVTFASTENGKQVVAFYQYTTTTTAQTISIKANKFTQAVKIFADGIWRDLETETDRAVKVNVFKARAMPNFTLTMSSTDFTKLEIEFDLYAVKDQVTGDFKYIDYIIL